ncbi:MAG: glyoxalase [Gammaproteobacteria bacterium]|nr:glyoxalase [Gammaproteobacteria bacterium]
MQIVKLDHVNLRTSRLDTMIDWYTKVLGLRRGKRPGFSFDGAWMYADDAAVVHLVSVDGEPGAGSEGELKLEHFALAASGRAEFEARLEAMGERYRRSDISDFKLVQINIWDPDGNHIHIDFPADE